MVAPKIVFLDADGVFILAYLRPTGQLTVALDTDCIERVNRICEKTGAQIVVSSNHRYSSDFRSKLLVYGITAPIIDDTPKWLGADPDCSEPLVSIGPRRDEEILAWLADHPEVTSWVALDDAPDTDRLGDRLIKTSLADGLTEDLCLKAIARLEKEDV